MTNAKFKRAKNGQFKPKSDIAAVNTLRRIANSRNRSFSSWGFRKITPAQLKKIADQVEAIGKENKRLLMENARLRQRAETTH